MFVSASFRSVRASTKNSRFRTREKMSTISFSRLESIYFFSFGDNSLHEFINSRSLNRLVTYFEQYRDLLSLHCKKNGYSREFLYIGEHIAPRVSREIPTIDKLLQRLRQSIDSKKNKNIEILSLSAEVRP